MTPYQTWIGLVSTVNQRVVATVILALSIAGGTTRWFMRGIKEDLRFIAKNLMVVEDVVLVKESGKLGWRRVELEEAHFIVP